MKEFVLESNRIEGIHRATEVEVAAHEKFLALDYVTVDDLIKFVSVCQPDAKLRNVPGLDVWVGNHLPPCGGEGVQYALEVLLYSMTTPYTTHLSYEHLHPFTDCNGRSGRVLWAWQMNKIHGKVPDIGFLHTFYYQTLGECDA